MGEASPVDLEFCSTQGEKCTQRHALPAWTLISLGSSRCWKGMCVAPTSAAMICDVILDERSLASATWRCRTTPTGRSEFMPKKHTHTREAMGNGMLRK